MAINLGVIFSEIRIQLSGLEEDAVHAKGLLGQMKQDVDEVSGTASDAGDQTDSLGSRFSHLLSPVRDISKGFADLAEHVGKFLSPVGDAIGAVHEFGEHVGTAVHTAMEPFVAIGSKVKDGFEKIGDVAGKIGAPIAHAASGMFNFADSVFKIAGGTVIAMGVRDGIHLLTDQVEDCVKAAQAQQLAMAQTTQVIKSTGGVAGVTAQHVDDLSTALSQTTTFSHETVESTQNLLLTFTNIGAAGGIFDQTTKTALDMSQALGEDTKSAAMQLGKALNDPLKGITALQRVGVTFTDQQKQQIKTMMQAGDTAGAQSIILKELNREFGGSAEAAGNTFAGALQRAKNSLEDVKVKIGNALIPVLSSLMSNVIAPLVSQFANVLPQALSVVTGFLSGTLMPAFQRVEPILHLIGQGVETVGKAFLTGLLPALRPIGDTFKQLTSSFSGMGDTLSKGNLQTLFKTLATYGQQFGTTLGQLATQAVKFLVPALMQIGQFAAQYVLPALLSLGRFVGTTVLPVVHSLATVFVQNIMPALRQVASTVLTRLLPPLEHLGKVVLPMLQPAFGLIGWLAQTIVAPALSLIATGLGGLIDALATVLSWVSNFVQMVVGFFQGLADTLVGHSIIPDMAAKIIKTIVDMVTGFLGHIKDLVVQVVIFFGSLEIQALQHIISMVGNILGKIGELRDQALAKATDLASGFLTALQDLPGKMLSLGGQIIQGLINGLKNELGNLGSMVSNVGGTILGGIKNMFGIASPSRVMAELGGYMSQGLVQGITGVDVAAAASAHYGALAAAGSLVAGLGGVAGGGTLGGGANGGALVNTLQLTVQVSPGPNDGSPSAAGAAFGQALGTALGPALKQALKQQGY